MDRPLEEEWRNYELYEKVRVRDQRKRFWTVFLASLLFLVLCAVPVIEERTPKWRGLQVARLLWVELEHMKTRAIQEKHPMRMRFLDQGRFKVELVQDCRNPMVLREEKVSDWAQGDSSIQVLGTKDLEHFGLKQGSDSICFDPVFGLDGIKGRKVIVIAPVKDLSEDRLDRASYVVLEGESAKISIN
jgi:hypothetical protein